MTTPLTSLPETWTDRAAELGRALSGRYAGTRHAYGLRIAAALLERGVAPEAVPAIVEHAAAAAGWNPQHNRQRALDTVTRWSNHLPVRADVPPELVPVLDAVCGAAPRSTASLAEEQDRLYRAIRDAGDGVTVIRAPCGLGKTAAARRVAAERAAEGKRTTISVPTNELAEQVTADLRAAGVTVCRIFGPTSMRGDGPDGYACAYRAAAAALADGWQSVRFELCEGRRKDPCPHRQSCPAAEGVDGPASALVLVGNHGLLTELERATNTKGLLIVDEPPEVLDDKDFSDDDLVEAQNQLPKFEAQHELAPAVALARAWLAQAPLDTPANLADADPDVPDALCGAGSSFGYLLELAQAEDVASAVENVIPDRMRAPQVHRLQLITTRTDPTTAGRIGRASKCLAYLHRALTEAGVRTTVFEQHRPAGAEGPRLRKLAITGVERQLHGVLRREGRVVVTAADAHLYVDHYEAAIGYRPPLVELGAPDGCAVRRVLVEARSVSRSRRPGPELVERALELACEGLEHRSDGGAPRVALVTYKAWADWAKRVGAVWAAARGATLATGHYGGLRGLDRWKAFDAVVTIGDPIPNLDAVARSIHAAAAGASAADDVHTRAVALARAELEQVFGRLRVVHRQSPCSMVHVGRLVPFGWPAGGNGHSGFERHEPARGRPAREDVDLGALQHIVASLGGQRAAAALCEASHTTVQRWLRGEARPPGKVLSLLRGAAEKADRKRAKRLERENATARGASE